MARQLCCLKSGEKSRRMYWEQAAAMGYSRVGSSIKLGRCLKGSLAIANDSVT